MFPCGTWRGNKLMKKINLFSRIKKPKEVEKNYVKKIRFYPSFMYANLDKWLKKMSLNGWHIVDCNIFSFWFEKGEPAEKEYFTYAEITHERKYSITLRHPFLEKTYGVKKKKSKINANKEKVYKIVEIDLQKIDIQNDVGYKELVSDRNRLFLRYFIRNFSVISVAIIFAIYLYLIFYK